VKIARIETLAASLQIGFAVPNYLIQEQSIGIEDHKGGEQLDYLVDRSVFDFSSGYLERLTAPGLGITIDEDAVRAADKNGHAWRTPLWRHSDGSRSLPGARGVVAEPVRPPQPPHPQHPQQQLKPKEKR
jgi:hypothetical protein